MPQGRIILKSISESKKLARLKTDGARLLYTWLITHLDVNGSFSADPDVVNGKIFTRLNKSRKTIVSYLDELEEKGLIIRFEANGDIFLNVPDFAEKQPNLQPNKEGKPTIPRPTPDQLQSKSTTSKVKESKVNISEVEVKENESHSTISSERIISAWQKLPLPEEKKSIAPTDILVVERQLSVLADDPIEPLHEGMILEAIENYKKALSLPSSQTYKHKLYPWLQRHVRKYTSYAFDIDHHNGSKFNKGVDTKSEYDKAKARGDL